MLSENDYLNQIEKRFNQVEEQIKAFIPENGRFIRLHGEIERLKKKYSGTNNRPLLFGIPVAIKDLYHIDGFETRAGSSLPPEALQGDEGEIIQKLRSLGALFLGKTVTTEFAYFAPGPTRNPHNLNCTPGGSSSGSAAAVAAGLSPLAFGTQTIGSIIRPAAFCGVVGFKPSQGKMSSKGIVPLAPSVDQPGYFTSDVASAEFVASMLISDWKELANSNNIKLAIPEGPYLTKVDQENLKYFYKVCKLISDCGYEVVKIQMLNDYVEIIKNHQVLVAAEAAIAHDRWFDDYYHLYHPKTLSMIEQGKNITSSDLEKSRQSCFQLREVLTELMESNHVTAILAPSATGPAPFGLHFTGDPVMNLPWTHAGLPVINIPYKSLSVDLPLGLQIVGRYGEDEILLNIAGILDSCLQNMQK